MTRKLKIKLIQNFKGHLSRLFTLYIGINSLEKIKKL